MFLASSSLRQSSVTGACICKAPTLLDTQAGQKHAQESSCLHDRFAIIQAQYTAGQDQPLVISSL